MKLYALLVISLFVKSVCGQSEINTNKEDNITRKYEFDNSDIFSDGMSGQNVSEAINITEITVSNTSIFSEENQPDMDINITQKSEAENNSSLANINEQSTSVELNENQTKIEQDEILDDDNVVTSNNKTDEKLQNLKNLKLVNVDSIVQSRAPENVKVSEISTGKFQKMLANISEDDFNIHFKRSRFFIGFPTTIVISTSAALNEMEYAVDLMTVNADYLIAQLINKKSTPYRGWRKTSYLGQTLRFYGIHEDPVPYQNCLYYAQKTTFWKIGMHELLLVFRLIDSDNEDASQITKTYTIYVTNKERSSCYPRIKVRQCSNARQPGIIDYQSTSVFLLEVPQGCAGKLMGPIKWKLYDWSETTLVSDLGETKDFIFKFVRGKLKLKTRKVGGVLFLLRVEAIIHNIKTVARCYVSILPGMLKLEIAGNHERFVSGHKPIAIHGEHSVDMSLPPTQYKNVKGLFTCQSNSDPKNNFNRPSSMASLIAKIVNIPKNALKIGKSYNFTLKIFSSIDESVMESATQLIHITNQRISKDIIPHILCIKNCEYNRFNNLEEIQLLAICLHCNEKTSVFQWRLDNKKMGNERYFKVRHPKKERFVVRLEIKSMRHVYSTEMILILNRGPVGGYCEIDPDSGIEATTDFKVVCIGFVARVEPITFRYVSIYKNEKEVPVESYVTIPNIRLRLPRADTLKITLCDFLGACSIIKLKVNVKGITINSKHTVKNFLHDPTGITNIRRHLRRGEWQISFVIAYTVIRQVRATKDVKYVFSELEKYELRTAIQLEQFFELTTKALENLLPLHYKKAEAIMHYFKKSATTFKRVVLDEEDLHRDAYQNILTGMISDLHMLAYRSENIPKAHCRSDEFECNKGQQEADNFEDFDEFDPKVAYRVTCWLNANWYLYQFMHYIGVKGTQRHSVLDEALIIDHGEGIIMFIHNYDADLHQNVQINTIDHLHRITISEALMNELKRVLMSEDVLIEIVSQQPSQNNFWWYPEALSPVTTILIVHAYSQHMKHDADVVQIDEPIQFVANLTPTETEQDWQSAYNWMLNGTITNARQMHTYKIQIEAQATLAVRFYRNSGAMIVMMTGNNAPTGETVLREGCYIPEKATHRRIIIQNSCNSKLNTFVSIRSYSPEELSQTRKKRNRKFRMDDQEGYLEKPLNYSFLLEIFKCNHWDQHLEPDPGWTPDKCQTIHNHEYEHSVICKCNVLGIYSARVFTAYARSFTDSVVLTKPVINWYMVLFYAMLVLILLIVLSTFTSGLQAHQVEDLIHCGEVVDEKINMAVGNDLVVIVTTGGQMAALTSSNVSLYFRNAGKDPVVFHINQDPEHPKLKCNSTCTLTLDTDAIRLPVQLAIQIKPQGRFPSWYCRTIEIYDVKRNEWQVFIIERWMYKGISPFYRSKHFSTPENQSQPYNWYQRFCHNLEQVFINWFMFQPLLGPWLSGNKSCAMNRFERSCVWISKAAILFCIIALFYGDTRRPRVISEEDEDFKTKFSPKTVVILCFLGYGATLLVDFLFQYIILHWILKRK